MGIIRVSNPLLSLKPDETKVVTNTFPILTSRCHVYVYDTFTVYRFNYWQMLYDQTETKTKDRKHP